MKNYSSTFSRQIGEHALVAELGRRSILATPFAGNVPEIDILASRNGKALPIQVKALANGDWSFQMTTFCQMTVDEGGFQHFGEPVVSPQGDTIHAFIKLGANAGEDEFYFLTWNELRDLVIDLHGAFLARNGGRRPRNPESMHVGVRLANVEPFKDRWSLFEDRLGV